MITQKEIAKRLGISRTTVARALNGSSSIKAETKKRVLELAKEMNYEKNIVGSSLGRKKIVYCFVVKSKNKFYTSEVVRGLELISKEYRSYGYKLEIILTDIKKPEKQIEELRKVLKKSEVDGVIITPLEKESVYAILEPYLEKIKVVSLGIELEKNIFHVGPDHMKQGRIAAGIMRSILRKNEKVLVLDNGDDKISSKKYLDGFLELVNSENIEVLGPFKCGSIEKSIEKIEEYSDETTGIYINRYAQDIYKKISRKYLKDKKIITNGISEDIKKMISDRVITATVMEEIVSEGYMAGKKMFELLYKGKGEEGGWEVSKSHIIYLENIDD